MSGRLKRSSSQDFEGGRDRHDGEFRRGGVRATATARLGWSQRSKLWVVFIFCDIIYTRMKIKCWLAIYSILHTHFSCHYPGLIRYTSLFQLPVLAVCLCVTWTWVCMVSCNWPTQQFSLSVAQVWHGYTICTLGRGPRYGMVEWNWPEYVPGRVQALGTQWGTVAEGICTRLREGRWLHQSCILETALLHCSSCFVTKDHHEPLLGPHLLLRWGISIAANLKISFKEDYLDAISSL